MLPASRYLTTAPDAPLSAAAEYRFFLGLQTSNGTRKTTAPGRLAALDELYFATAARLGVVPATVMDIGISSGVTTAEWLQGFEDRGHAVTCIATDLVISVYLHRIGCDLRALTESNGHILQLEWFGLGIRTDRRRRDYVSGAVIWRRALRGFARTRLARSPREGPYPLVSPKLRHRPGVELRDDDILAPTPLELCGCADVIRVANLIQRAYFIDDQIALAVGHVRERCRGEGSLVVVCRDVDGRLEGSVLRLGAGGDFTVEARLGGGSEVENFFTTAPREGDDR